MNRGGLTDSLKSRTLFIITKHQKETVIAPVWQHRIGGPITVFSSFDTDAFGTFSGTVERKKPARETLRDKLVAGMQEAGATLGIASEGSFGPHPTLPFLPCNEELVMLIDREQNLEITGRAITTDTNFSSLQTGDWIAVLRFLEQIHFPEHGLMVKHAQEKSVRFYNDLQKLEEEIKPILEPGTPLLFETDMRAMHNPTRLKVIEQGMQDLMNKLFSPCPACGHPGFEVTEAIPGLPCSWCGLPTRLIMQEIYTCRQCGCSQTNRRPEETADPQYCDHCNP
jgi:hypothetical protein